MSLVLDAEEESEVEDSEGNYVSWESSCSNRVRASAVRTHESWTI